MARMKIEWNRRIARGPGLRGGYAFEPVMRLPGVDRLLRGVVNDILAQPHEGTWVGNVEAGRTRSRGGVVTADAAAIIDNSRNQSLLRAANQVRRT